MITFTVYWFNDPLSNVFFISMGVVIGIRVIKIIIEIIPVA